jgi:small subunit ribosomal protein S9
MTAQSQTLYGLGRRKTARAQALLLPGEGGHLVNTIDLAAYFPTLEMQQAAQLPLILTSQQKSFHAKIKVSGGGKRAQAEAVKLALARALLKADAGWHKQLKEAGCLKRDPRMKERKKPGLKRARRAPQFSKR